MISNISTLKVKLFYLAFIISILGHSVDLLLLEYNKIIIYFDITTILLTIVVFILYRFKQLPINWANIFIIYSSSINIAASIITVDTQNIFAYFLISALVYGALVLYAGFTLNKTHVIIFGISYIIFFVFIASYSHDNYLQKAAPLILILLSGYLIGVIFLVQIIEKSNLFQTELIDNLENKNQLLKEHEKELKALNNAKDKLLSIIGHDLRTPSNSIMGFAELISAKAEAQNNKSIKEYSKHIYRASNSLNFLLSQLLDWARLQTGKVSVNLQLVNINKIITEVINLMQGTIYLKNITVIFSNTSNILINCDKQMISTVIRNLLSNALKYTPKNGTITIKSIITNNEYHFSIKNTGKGMSALTLNELFNNLIIKSEPGTENEKGTGLGLTICIEYINFHNGNIWAKSEFEKHSTFFFTLPFKQ